MANNYSRRFRIGIILLLFLILFVRISLEFSDGSSAEKSSIPVGHWKIAYHYANDANLIYTGEMQISESDDSIIVDISVKPPRSIRTESLLVEDSKFVDGLLTGRMIHNTYKIKGGFLTESFELTFTDDDSLHGSGKCLDHCAEGTERMGIIWTGQKKTANL